MADATNYVPSVGAVLYSQAQANGVIVIIVVSVVSLVALMGLLAGLIIVALRPKFNTTADYLFLQSNFGLYFISLLVANAIAALGSVMNAHWVSQKAVVIGGFCTAQGSIKNIGNVATALWTLVIAIHVFNLLFLRHQTKRLAGIFTTIAVWSAVLTIDIFGPAVLVKRRLGPFFGVAGFWCWISQNYPGARVGLEYFWFFFSGALSFVLYGLVFLRLRGNITFPEGSRIPKFTWVSREKAWKLQANRDIVDAHMTDVAKQMIWFPVAYTIVILPIAIDRFVSDAGNEVSFEWFIFADSLFMSSGLINVILFMSTRKALPTPGLLPTFNIPRKPPPSTFIPPPEPKNGDVNPFIVSPTGSDKSFGTRDRNSQRLDFVEDEKVVVTNLGGTFRGHAVVASDTSARAVNAAVPEPTDPAQGNEIHRNRPPSPPVDHHHLRQGSYDSTLPNPFGDHAAESESESEDEYDGYGRRRRSDWHPSLSAYFDDVDLTTPRPEQSRFPRTPTASAYTPPVPTLQTKNIPNRI